jgi:MFS transporter, SHS family, lactate transporter
MPNPFRGLTSRQRHTFAACFLGWTMDSFDFFILVFCVSAVSADFHVAKSQVAAALAITLAFRPIGALLFGALADRYGRRPVLMFNVACYSLLELACAFSASMPSLLVLRALFGVAMGGEWGVGAALAFETLPKENRGFFSGLLQMGYATGYLIAAAAYALLFPWFSRFTWYGHAFGWRGMFLVGALPAVLVVYIGGKVHESPTWTAGRAATARSEGSVSGTLRSILGYSGTFLFLVLLMTGFNSFSHGTQDLYPTFLQQDHGFTPRLTGLVAILYNIAAICGGISFGAFSEKVGRKRAIICASLLSLPVIPLFAFSRSAAMLALGAMLMQFMVQGAWGVVPAWLSELSPGPVRATIPGLTYQLGNLLSSWNDVIQSRMAERVGSYGMVLAVTVVIVGCYIALVASFGRESKGAELGAT